MKVKELIKLLENVDPNKDAVYSKSEYDFYEVEENRYTVILSSSEDFEQKLEYE